MSSGEVVVVDFSFMFWKCGVVMVHGRESVPVVKGVFYWSFFGS